MHARSRCDDTRVSTQPEALDGRILRRCSRRCRVWRPKGPAGTPEALRRAGRSGGGGRNPPPPLLAAQSSGAAARPSRARAA
eukprot:11531591-Alexandrium_andersonii.AAC.1